MLGTACLIGVLGVAAACLTYDLVATAQSQWTLAILGALGAATAESVAMRSARVRRKWSLRWVLPVYGALFGAGILYAAPISVSQQLSVLTVAPYVSVFGSGFNDYVGTGLVNTLCAAVTSPVTMLHGTGVTCDQAISYFPDNPPSLAFVTVRGSSVAGVEAEIHHAFAPIFRSMPMEGGASGPLERGKPTWAVTAPLWAGAVGLYLMLSVPPLGRRRRPSHSRNNTWRPGDSTQPDQQCVAPAEPMATAVR
jgi:hypothetical protein